MDLAPTIEHTLLRPDATPGAIDLLTDEAVQYGFAGVCVQPLFVERVALRVRDMRSPRLPRVVTVVGFPLGANLAASKADEARRLVDVGAQEIDMVIPIGLGVAKRYDEITEHVRAVREAIGDAVLKVILETGFFRGEALEPVVDAVLLARPDFLKTSTGFGPGGADPDEVSFLKSRCPEGVEVKASGGIRDRAQAEALIAAGASRLGTSSSLALLAAI
jgi:deoxyribose-phosphate aldolase